MSESARLSIQNAKKMLPTVEFVARQVAHSVDIELFHQLQVAHHDLNAIYQKLYQISENTCCCPSLAYILFYPELVNSRVPFFVAGNEPGKSKSFFTTIWPRRLPIDTTKAKF